MLTLYLITLVVGGTLIVSSVVLGGFDSDADLALDAPELSLEANADVDAHADFDAHADAGGDGIGDALSAWLPFASMRFWTFALAFFGLTGTLLTTLTSIGSATVIACLSGAMGYACGTTTSRVIKKLQAAEIDSSIHESDYIGAQGKVVVPIEGTELGKVRLHIKGNVVEQIARSEDGANLSIGQAVIVYSIDDQGCLIVSQIEQLGA